MKHIVIFFLKNARNSGNFVVSLGVAILMPTKTLTESILDMYVPCKKDGVKFALASCVLK